MLVSIELPPGDPGLHGSLGHGRRHPKEDALVEGLGQDVLQPEVHDLFAICFGQLLGQILPRQLGERSGGGNHHLAVDRRRTHIQGPPENEGESQGVADLVGAVDSPGRHDQIAPHRAGFIVRNFWIRARQGKHDGSIRHRGDHLLGHQSPDRAAHQDVCPFHRVSERSRLCLPGKADLVGIHFPLAALVEHTPIIDHQDILERHPQLKQEVAAAYARRAAAGDHQTDIVDPLSLQLEGVEKRRHTDGSRPMLLVAEDRDLT